MQNYYETLGVSEKATLEEIKKSYYKKQKLYHPDVYKGDSISAEKFVRELNEAYNILKDEVKRASYNLSLRTERNKNRVVNNTNAYSTSSATQTVYENPFMTVKSVFTSDTQKGTVETDIPKSKKVTVKKIKEDDEFEYYKVKEKEDYSIIGDLKAKRKQKLDNKGVVESPSDIKVKIIIFALSIIMFILIILYILL